MEYRKTDELKKLKDNPRIIKNKDFKILCKSIKDNPDYFEARPIILSDRTGELIVIAGNQRLEAAKFNKLEQVPTYTISGLSEEREKEIIVRDNVSNGDWDYAILKDWDIKNLSDWGVDLTKNMKNSNETDIKIYRLFQLTIDCKDEKELKQKFEELQKLGFSVNILQI